MSSAIYVAIAALAACLIFYVINKRRTLNRVKNHEDENYKVPLSDDIQKIYYEKYEQELKKSEEEKSADDQHPEE